MTSNNFSGIGLLALAIAAGGTVACAQQQAGEREGGLAERFKRFDRNGDGKLDASEAGERPFFKPADKNGDGVLTLDEVKTYFGSRPSGRSPAAPKPQPTEKP